MKLKDLPTTSTPTASTQAVLRFGGVRQAFLGVPAAFVIGTAAMGSPSLGSAPTSPTAVTSINRRLIDLLGGSELSAAPFSCPGKRLVPATDGSIPAELRAYLESRLLAGSSEAIEGSGDADYDLNARLAPPPMQERRVRVRFKFIGREAARIRTEAESE